MHWRSAQTFLLHSPSPATSTVLAAIPDYSRQPEPPYPLQNRPEQPHRHDNLRYLEDQVPGVGHDLRPALDQLLTQSRLAGISDQWLTDRGRANRRRKFPRL
jgi:hypothetical protein